MASTFWKMPFGHVPESMESEFGPIEISQDFLTDNLILKTPQGWRREISRQALKDARYPRHLVRADIDRWYGDLCRKFGGPSWFSAYQRALAEARSRQ